jgi:hypothetical protein
LNQAASKMSADPNTTQMGMRRSFHAWPVRVKTPREVAI